MNGGSTFVLEKEKKTIMEQTSKTNHIEKDWSV
jgi:hypothetical protein